MTEIQGIQTSEEVNKIKEESKESNAGGAIQA